MTLLGGVYRVAERVGRCKAMEWALTSERVAAAEMERFGVINRVVPDAELVDAATTFARTVAHGPTRAHAAHKALLRTWAVGGVAAADEAMFDIAIHHCGRPRTPAPPSPRPSRRCGPVVGAPPCGSRGGDGAMVLSHQVHAAPGIPTEITDLPADLDRRWWSPITATLISGERDAVLVDALLTGDQAERLADRVEASGKNLTTVYVTHGHGDHWFGLGVLLRRFPTARAVATAAVLEHARAQAAGVRRVLLGRPVPRPAADAVGAARAAGPRCAGARG